MSQNEFILRILQQNCWSSSCACEKSSALAPVVPAQEHYSHLHPHQVACTWLNYAILPTGPSHQLLMAFTAPRYQLNAPAVIRNLRSGAWHQPLQPKAQYNEMWDVDRPKCSARSFNVQWHVNAIHCQHHSTIITFHFIPSTSSAASSIIRMCRLVNLPCLPLQAAVHSRCHSTCHSELLQIRFLSSDFVSAVIQAKRVRAAGCRICLKYCLGIEIRPSESGFPLHPRNRLTHARIKVLIRISNNSDHILHCYTL